MYPFEIKNKEVEKFNDQLGDVLRELFSNGDEFPYEAAMGINATFTTPWCCELSSREQHIYTETLQH